MKKEYFNKVDFKDGTSVEIIFEKTQLNPFAICVLSNTHLFSEDGKPVFIKSLISPWYSSLGTAENRLLEYMHEYEKTKQHGEVVDVYVTQTEILLKNDPKYNKESNTRCRKSTK